MVSADCAAKHFLFQKIISHCKCNAILENGIWQKITDVYYPHKHGLCLLVFLFTFPPLWIGVFKIYGIVTTVFTQFYILPFSPNVS